MTSSWRWFIHPDTAISMNRNGSRTLCVFKVHYRDHRAAVGNHRRFTQTQFSDHWIEQIFGLRRRRVIELMHQFGGCQSGRTFLLDRARLLEALQSLEPREDYSAEKRRRERLGDVVEASREHLVSMRARIPVRAVAAPASLDRLAPGVLLLPGVLSIEFRRPTELLEKLYWLAQAIVHDFEKFEGLLPGDGE